MDFRHTKTAKLFAFILLFLFVWTFCGIYDIAFAAKNDAFAAPKSSVKKKEEVEKEFEQEIEDIDGIVEKLGVVKTKKERKALKKELRAKKKRIRKLDKKLKAKFDETRKRLKEAGLPNETIKRHNDFVKKYEENLKELELNIDDIDRARTIDEEDKTIKKVKGYLKKVGKKKKRRTFDPNKLPHRAAEPTRKKPRLNKEEFQNDSDQQIAFSGQQSEPILVAANGPLTGLMDSPLPASSLEKRIFNDDMLQMDSTLNIEPDTQHTLLLAAAGPPTDADLAETIEVRFTDAIKARAAELEHNPVKIYNWVRNNVEYVPTYGSIQGADYCLQTLYCNAFDTASLLIALLRTSNIPAKYVFGTVEIPSEKVMNWTGNFQDPMYAMDFMSMGGIPRSGMLVGDEIKYIRLEHVWVEAYVDYFPSRGARHKEGQGDAWIPLDASFKQYNYTEGIDIQEAVPFDAQSFIGRIQSTAIINEQDGSVTGVDSLYIQQTMDEYQTQVENYINQNHPDATVGDVLGKKEIIKQEFSYLLGTLPYRIIVTGQKRSEIPANLRHRISFKVVKDMYDELIGTPLNISMSLPELAGKKITLSYSPATQADEDVINSYIPEPNPDGTPIDPSQLPQSLPAYLINVKPELRIDGQVVAAGTQAGLGADSTFTMTFSAPNFSTDRIENEITAGEYYGVALDLGKVSTMQMEGLKTKLENTKAKLEAEDLTNLTKDDIVGDLLFITALSYFAELDIMDFAQTKSLSVAAVHLPSESLFSHELSVYKPFGIPVSVSSGGFAMDVDRQFSMVKAFDGDSEKARQYFLSSGSNGSALEHSVPEQMFSATDNSTLSLPFVEVGRTRLSYSKLRPPFLQGIFSQGQ